MVDGDRNAPRTEAEMYNWLRDSTPRNKQGRSPQCSCVSVAERNTHSLKKGRVELSAGKTMK